MKNILYTVLSKWPVKVLMMTTVLVIALAFFATRITLSTGNETLIDPDTNIYQDNYTYQQTFGSDPIMVILEGDNHDDLLSYESLELIHHMVEEVEGMDGIFFVNSPIGVIDYAVQRSYQQYQEGLTELSTGLIQLSTNMQSLSLVDGDMDPATLLQTFATLSTAQSEVSGNATNQVAALQTMKTTVASEITRLEAIQAGLDPVADQPDYQSVTQTIMLLTNINGVYDQMITMNTQLATGASTTSGALDQIATELGTLFTTVSFAQDNLTMIATNLETMGQTLATLSANFNMFTGRFPTSSDTLAQIVYPGGTLNPMMERYLLDDTHLYISILLEESVSNDEIEAIITSIEDSFAGTMHEDSLISGKPVLDYDIQSSMMESMRIMMASAGIIMILVLFLLFPVKARLLPLAIVLIAVVTTVGIMGLFTIPLTMVSMAVFPVLIGLGIDYSIQFHNRYLEESEEGVVHEA